MRRRNLIILLGSATAGWPLVAYAQLAKLPVIGLLGSGSAATLASPLAGLRRGLGETGFDEGRNLAFEYRWADGDYSRLPTLAAELVRRKVALIVASGGDIAALAAKAATKTIPIVFTATADPVKAGLVASLNRPGGNVTGIGGLIGELDQKRLEQLHEMVRAPGTFGVLLNPRSPTVDARKTEVLAASRALDRPIVFLSASIEQEIDAAFVTLMRQRHLGLVVGADPFFTSRREQLIALAARHGIPAIYQWRDFTVAGGLMSYGSSLTESYRQAGVYAGRILNGSKPADLPVMQASKFELVLNLKTAKSLGLTVPPALLVRADELIE